MENTTETRNEMLSWHKPQVQKLTINVDTHSAAAVGSSDFAADG